MKPLISLLSLAVAVCLLSLTPLDANADDKASGGKTETKVEHVDAEGAAKLIAEKKVVVIDIRTPEEYKEGHIAGAKLINFRSNAFEPTLEKLDKDQTYLVHCAAGTRSTRSLSTFKRLEFKSIVHLDGGFTAWQKAGKPVEK
jgi:rhodanese-related sulfurtransferase